MGSTLLPHTTPSAVITGFSTGKSLISPFSHCGHSHLVELREVTDKLSETPQQCKRNLFLLVISQVAGSTRGLCAIKLV